MNKHLLKSSATLAALGAILCAVPVVNAAERSTDDTPGSQAIKSARKSGGQSASDIIGKKVKNSQGEDLGKVADLVVSTNSGKIAYVLVSSGGLLGVGDRVRAVPFSALKHDYSTDGSLKIDIARADWDRAPVMQNDDLTSLASEENSRAIYEHYRTGFSDDVRRLFQRTDQNQALARVTEVDGYEVRAGGQEAGEIDDVIVNFDRGTAAALLDPEDDFTGNDQKLVVSFNQLSRSATDDHVLTTNLTREDFRRATPMRSDSNNSLEDAASYPYIWSGYGFASGTAYNPAAPADRRVIADRNAAAGSRENRETVAMIRGALRSDEDLRDAVQDVTIRESDNRLVVSGVVRSQDIKDKIEDRLEEAARGWDIDNQVVVSAAE